jgi:hypothetical protein
MESDMRSQAGDLVSILGEHIGQDLVVSLHHTISLHLQLIHSTITRIYILVGFPWADPHPC